jgi:hypothetical protein
MSPGNKICAAVPGHLAAVQLLVNRCPTPELKKSLIVQVACHAAIGRRDGELLMTANQLETA